MTPEAGRWTIGALLEAERTGQRLKFVFFWGGSSHPDGEIGSHVLSQWYEHPFTAEGVLYRTAEHYMMAAKARLFGDSPRLELILAAATPGEAKAHGASVHDFDEATWEERRFDIVVAGSVAKFSSDDRLRSYLVGTGERVLVEASPRDRIWGIGLSRHDPDAERPSRWAGSNLLGFALMEARSRLG